MFQSPARSFSSSVCRGGSRGSGLSPAENDASSAGEGDEGGDDIARCSLSRGRASVTPTAAVHLTLLVGRRRDYCLDLGAPDGGFPSPAQRPSGRSRNSRRVAGG